MRLLEHPASTWYRFLFEDLRSDEVIMAIVLRQYRNVRHSFLNILPQRALTFVQCEHIYVSSKKQAVILSAGHGRLYTTDFGDLRQCKVLGKTYECDDMTSITPAIISRVGRSLHNVPQHPINIIKQRIVNHFHKIYTNRKGNAIYAHFDNVSPVVTTEQNFDSLLVAPDHVTRSKNDNYYINSTTMLRAHTSAHQRDFIRMGCNHFLVTGDVYRRDEIDSSHYPVFHQMEGVRLFSREELFRSSSGEESDLTLFEMGSDLNVAETSEKQAMHTFDAVKMMEFNLKDTLILLMKELFGSDIETRWTNCYFPFTHPSYELEIKFQGEWMEMLGSGIMRQPILENGGVTDRIGWAFGLGLDRLAMLLFDVPDIRLFWSRDERFLEQFSTVGIDPKTNIKFQPYSKYPACYKDVAFWLPETFSENDFHEVVRSSAEDLVEKVELIDKFCQPKTDKMSHCYRITYRSMDRNVTNEEINVIQDQIRKVIVEQLNVELR